MKGPAELPIYQYSDYRTFLLDHAQKKKLAKPRWSLGCWARQLGLKSTSSLTKVLQGKRNPGPEMTQALVLYFGFPKVEADYFRDLVELTKNAHDPHLSLLLLERMQKKHPEGSVRLLNDREFTLLSNWYGLAVRELVRAKNFQENPEEIAKRFLFRVTPAEVRRTIEILLGLGLMKRNRAGRLAVVDREIETTSDIASEAGKRHHEQTFLQISWANREMPIPEREITNTTFVMKSSNLPRAKEVLRQMKQSFVEQFEEEGGDAVFRVQLQLLPLTQLEQSDKEKARVE